MDDKNLLEQQKLLQTIPGGLVKLAIDNILTILYSTESFNLLIKNVSDKDGSLSNQGLLKMVYSADIIWVTQQLAQQRQRKDGLLNFYFRTLQQDGSFKWVMISGKRTDEVYQSGMKEVPVYSCGAFDATDYIFQLKHTEQKLDYQRVVSELSRELFFEYEIASDTLSFTELFHEVFDRDSKIPGFRKKLIKTTIIHPDELPAVINIFNAMMNGRKQVRFELRMIPKDGTPVWYICYASIIFDENRNPHKVVGKLAVAKTMNREEEKSIIKPQLDALTKVCTKDAAEALIKEAINKQDEDIMSSLMIVEVRNYKGMNEIMRNMNGNNILAIMSDYIKAHFRSSDIIGRLGLNEFVVYVKNIHSDKIVYDNAERLCQEVEGLYSYQHTKNTPSISIGIAFVKGQQMDYPGLLANANTALVMAKKINTSSFEVFYGGMN